MDNLIKQILIDLENELDKKDVKYFYFGKPYNISNDMCNQGVIMIKPRSEELTAITTGVQDQTIYNFDIILARNMKGKVYANAQQESADIFLTRVMAGKTGVNTLNPQSIRYVIRKNMRSYGSRQPTIRITYDDNKVDLEGVVTATMEVTQENIYSQTIV